jgi:hypothetical protein
MRSCVGLVMFDSTTVSPDRTDFTRASKVIAEQSQHHYRETIAGKECNEEKKRQKGKNQDEE